MGPAAAQPLAAATRAALAQALAFLLPVTCGGCGRDGVALCEACRTALAPAPRVRTVGGLAVWHALAYEGACAGALRVLKEAGRTDLARALAPALREALRAAAAAADRPLLPVVVPTSASALRRRGYRVPELLARRAGVRPARLLVARRATADQRALGRAARQRNVAGSLRALAAVAGRDVVIVDDVVTTGATLAEARRALEAGGARVVAAAVAAATPRRAVRTSAGDPQPPT